MSIYDSGDTVRLSAIFCDSAQTTGDPTVVRLKWLQPNGVSSSATYGTGTALVRQATGIYYLDTGLGAAGTYRYRWESEGSLPGAEEGWFTIRQPKL